MFGFNNLCHTDKCCVCAKSCLDPMQRIDRPDFILADKAILEQRLNYIDEYAFNDSEKMNIISVLCQMKREERETKEKEYMKEDITRTEQITRARYIECKIESAREEGYKAGLEEAWEIARKIELCLLTCGYTYSQLMAIFNSPSPNEILEKLTIHEVKEKIAAYEAEQAKPKLGDVVNIDDRGEFLFLGEGSEHYYVLDPDDNDGIPHQFVKKHTANSIRKTGKHFDIQSMLDEIG